VTPQGRVKVLDFGLAKPSGKAGTSGEAALTEYGTEQGRIIGTPGYMSPEQVRGLEVDARTDIWAFGCVLYELLAGQRAFRGQTISDVLARVLEREPDWKDLPVATPAKVRSLLAECLEKDPGRRLQSIGEAHRRIAEAQSRGRGLTRRQLAAASGLAAAAALVAAALDVGSLRSRLASASPAIQSVAVLPLANLSGDPAQEYFSDGLTDALITSLSRISALKVISRTSIMQYKGAKKTLRDIARELGVEAIIEGSVVRSGGRVRINAQLIQAATEKNLWAESYERDMQDLLRLQSEVAQAIAQRVQVTLTPQEQTRLAARQRVNPEAYDAYLKGCVHYYRVTPEDFETAMKYFRLALEKDPNFAQAYAGIAWVEGSRAHIGMTPPEDGWPKAKAAAAKALSLDPALTEAHGALAVVHYLYDWDWTAADAEFRRALKLDPNNALMQATYAEFLAVLHRWDEWEPRIRRALELDPNNAFFQALYGMQLLFRRRYDDAMVELRKALPMDPNSLVTHFTLWQAYYLKRMQPEAFAEAKTSLSLWGQAEAAEALQRGYARGGYREANRLAAESLAARAQREYVTPFIVAAFYVEAGLNSRAVDWLEKSFLAHDSQVVYVNVDPTFDVLRDDPRFQALLSRLKFPPR